ncbi:hypothetical protein GWI33_014434 [Rhynchophorus ferrugineus]|uniref:Uncharacterized protein n=1 Tax=Rhynchophorus ferrugineus TaxID=354439 RepID=A0A834I520_RHYFE|nr:hypothetical protein GWI33_014434 [Rhynchophorus ferrugineus]
MITAATGGKKRGPKGEKEKESVKLSPSSSSYSRIVLIDDRSPAEPICDIKSFDAASCAATSYSEAKKWKDARELFRQGGGGGGDGGLLRTGQFYWQVRCE